MTKIHLFVCVFVAGGAGSASSLVQTGLGPGGQEGAPHWLSSISVPGQTIPGPVLAQANHLESSAAVSNPESVESNRLPSASSAAPSEQFDFLDFGDPTFASSGFITARPDSHPTVSPERPSAPSRVSVWQAQQPLVSVDPVDGLCDLPWKRDTIGCDVSSREPAHLLPAAFTVDGSDSVAELSPLHRLPSYFNQNNHQPAHVEVGSREATRTARDNLMLFDFTVQQEDERPNAPLVAFGNRRLDAANYYSGDFSDLKRRSVIGTVSTAALVPRSGREHSATTSIAGSETGFMSEVSAIRGAVEELPPTARFTTYAKKPSGDDLYDTGVSVLSSSSTRLPHPPLLTDQHERRAAGGDGTGRLPQFTVPGTEGPGEADDVFSGPACSYLSPSHVTPPLSDVAFALPGAYISPRRTPPQQKRFSSRPVETKVGNPSRFYTGAVLTDCDRCQPAKQLLGNRSSHRVDTHRLRNTYAGSEIVGPASPAPGSSAGISRSQRRMDGRKRNGDIQLKPHQHHRQKQSWTSKSHREFSPLPTASSSADEEENDDHDERVELTPRSLRERQSGTDNSSQHRQARRQRHCHTPEMTSLTDSLARRQLVAVVVLCVVFMVGEAVGEFCFVFLSFGCRVYLELYTVLDTRLSCTEFPLWYLELCYAMNFTEVDT